MMASLLSGHWLPLVINIALQSLCVLGAVAIALACTRKASAARRHLISVAALGALLLVPLMSLLIPAPQPLIQMSGPGLTLRRSPLRTLSASAPTRASNIASAAPALASAPSPLVSYSPLTATVAPQTTPSAAHTAAASVSFSHFAPWLAASWFMGVLVVLGRLLIGWGRVRQMARQSHPVLSESLQAGIQALLSAVGFERPLTLLQASSRNPISVAMTWGLRKATLLLPAEAAQWPVERLRVVVLHELAHIRRYDWLTQMFGQFVCALYWFHPLVWLLNRHTQIEAERACDDAVLLAGVRAKEYATHLLEVVKAIQAGREAPSAAVAMARPTQVRYRLQSILNAKRDRQSPTRSVRRLVLAVMALLLVAISWIRPLAWAKGQQQATPSRPSTAIGPVVTLPNGISVELVAVGSSPLGFGEDWWTPNGKPVLELPIGEGNSFASRESGYAERLLRRSLFLRLKASSQTTQTIDISTTGYVVDPTQQLQTDLYRYGRNYRYEGSILPARAATGTVLLGLPPAETRCAYQFGIAIGPWETLATTPFAQHPAPDSISLPAKAILDETFLVLDDSPHIRYRTADGQEHTLSLLGDHAPLGDVARRILVLDKDGKEIPMEDYGEDIQGGKKRIPAGKLPHIVAFRLQTRPYQWAEFKDILLKRPYTVAPPAVATPPALPAFHHTFASGLTLTVPAVTERRGEGGAWWQPDGKLLAGPLKEYAQSVNFQGWEQGTHPRILLLQLKSSHPLAYTTTARFTPSTSDATDMALHGYVNHIEGNRPVSTWAGHDFPQNLSHTTLRYGVAAGPWRTVASIAMPTDIRRDDPKYANNSDLTLELHGFPKKGDLPRLQYTTLAGNYVNLPFKINDTTYLDDVARRFVAVDKSGKILLLYSGEAAQLILDKAGKPIPLDPANAGKTNLTVGEYKRIELDLVSLSFHDKNAWIMGYPPVDLTQIREFRLEVRPFEWVEFPNIALQPKRGGAGH